MFHTSSNRESEREHPPLRTIRHWKTPRLFSCALERRVGRFLTPSRPVSSSSLFLLECDLRPFHHHSHQASRTRGRPLNFTRVFFFSLHFSSHFSRDPTKNTAAISYLNNEVALSTSAYIHHHSKILLRSLSLLLKFSITLAGVSAQRPPDSNHLSWG